jgi:hypothetical protein
VGGTKYVGVTAGPQAANHAVAVMTSKRRRDPWNPVLWLRWLEHIAAALAFTQALSSVLDNFATR